MKMKRMLHNKKWLLTAAAVTLAAAVAIPLLITALNSRLPVDLHSQETTQEASATAPQSTATETTAAPATAAESATQAETTEPDTTKPAETTKKQETAQTTQKETTTKQSDDGKYDLPKPAMAVISSDKWYLTLVNKYYGLPSDWRPPSLTLVPDGNRASAGKGYMDSRAQPYYVDMYNAAKADGITLVPVSVFREYDFQAKLYEKQIKKQLSKGYSEKRAKFEAARVVAQPGTSDHQLGLGIDIGWINEGFENAKEFKWLKSHAQDYGFILRYAKNKTDITHVIYEPWHWRYVGVEAAQKMKNSGQCLEEYLGKVK